jgi:hypothetical protein
MGDVPIVSAAQMLSRIRADDDEPLIESVGNGPQRAQVVPETWLLPSLETRSRVKQGWRSTSKTSRKFASSAFRLHEA